MFSLAGVPAAEASKKAAAIYELEHKFAEVHWTVVDSRDSDKAYNKWTKADFMSAFEAKDRTKGGITAPPDGLYLVRIDY